MNQLFLFALIYILAILFYCAATDAYKNKHNSESLKEDRAEPVGHKILDGYEDATDDIEDENGIDIAVHRLEDIDESDYENENNPLKTDQNIIEDEEMNPLRTPKRRRRSRRRRSSSQRRRRTYKSRRHYTKRKARMPICYRKKRSHCHRLCYWGRCWNHCFAYRKKICH